MAKDFFPLIPFFKTGLLAALLDGLAAVVNAYLARGTSPVIVFQYIASGALGRDAFAGGLLTAAAGVVIHCTIAISWSALYFFAYPRLSLIRKNRVASGIGYGLFVWLIMNLVVLPMTRIPSRPFVLLNALTGILILMGMVGLPVSFMAKYFFERRNIR